MAGLARWNDHFKLVHLMSALRGAARAFYHSCTPVQRSNYHILVAELKKRFTPVQLTAIQTQLFHSHRQGPKESVDEFAQELRRLHSKAYSTATFANPEAEVGQMVLANQFISGLRSELQAKAVGMEGTLDALVLKAHFEEAKAKELAEVKTSTPRRLVSTGGPMLPGSIHRQTETPTPVTTSAVTTSMKEDNRKTSSRKCYNWSGRPCRTQLSVFEDHQRGEGSPGKALCEQCNYAGVRSECDASGDKSRRRASGTLPGRTARCDQ